MKILIFGASGTVGNPLFNTLAEKYEVYGTFNKNRPANATDGRWYKYDMTTATPISVLLETVKPDLIISSLTGDFEQQLAAHKEMAAYLQTHGQMIFISTANVFDGDVKGRHSESSVPYPISSYGKFKQTCENLLQTTLGNRCLIIRLPKIMDKATAEKWLTQAETGNPPIYENLYLSFNTAKNVADTISYCVDIGKTGLLHLTSNDDISIDECMQLLLTQKNKTAAYIPQRLTTESYCNLLGCKDTSLLRHNGDDNFRLSMVRTDAAVAQFNITCRETLGHLR